MAVRRHTNDHPRPDLDLEAAYDRIDGLRASARSSRPWSSPGPGLLVRWRDAVGRRLIAIGTALVTEETLRRRPALRP
jgi:hypothetical protein